MPGSPWTALGPGNVVKEEMIGSVGVGRLVREQWGAERLYNR